MSMRMPSATKKGPGRRPLTERNVFKMQDNIPGFGNKLARAANEKKIAVKHLGFRWSAGLGFH